MLEFLLADLEVKAAYKSSGEQIDGSFFLFGQTFLIEAKWHKDPLSASEIYSFQGRLTGNFTRPPEYLYLILAIAMML